MGRVEVGINAYYVNIDLILFDILSAPEGTGILGYWRKMRSEPRLTFPLLLENALTSWMTPNYQSWFSDFRLCRT